MSGQRKIIYIVEDNEDYALYVKHLLEGTGWAETRIYHDGVRGLQACLESPPQCLVLDLELPGMRGEEICRIVRSTSRFKSLPVIIISQLPDAKRREMEMLSLGADAYFKKPIESGEFLNSILLNVSLAEPLFDSAPPEKEETSISKPPSTQSRPDETQLRKDAEHPDFHGYEIIGMIGGGGMGTVYKAKQISLDRIVALKVLSQKYSEDTSVFQRFLREAQILAQLTHPHIVQIYDIGKSELAPFFVMEYVEGKTLEELFLEKPPSPEEVEKIIRQTVDALEYLHSKDVIHRDVKLSNIILSREGMVKLTDFGVSRAKLPSEMAEFTQVLQVVGTPAYMAPEVREGDPATRLSDQYSFGMTMAKLFLPGEERKKFYTRESILNNIPESLRKPVSRCMEFLPENRYPSLKEAEKEFIAALNI